MTVQEMFRLFDEYPLDTDSVTKMFSDFMYLSMSCAHLQQIHFSSLEDYQEDDCRKCKICGNIQHTEVSFSCGFGRVCIADCTNEDCKLVREFFNIKNIYLYPQPVAIAGVSDKYKLQNWYRATLEKTFGIKQIYKIPIEKRLEVLLAMMLMRKAMDKDHEVIEKLAA